MGVDDKASLYRGLKEAGVEFDKPYRNLTLEDLTAAAAEHDRQTAPEPAESEPAPASFFGLASEPEPEPEPPKQPVSQAAATLPDGVRPHIFDDLEPLRTDEHGRVWFQEEVRKPATPRSRGRRVLRYFDTGVKKETVQSGEYTETVEVAGDGQARELTVKITLPSYQVGIYKDRRFPFRVVCYNGNEGFHLFEVQQFYGGAELVPPEIKRKYVENVLCYDIRSVIAAIVREDRERTLGARLP